MYSSDSLTLDIADNNCYSRESSAYQNQRETKCNPYNNYQASRPTSDRTPHQSQSQGPSSNPETERASPPSQSQTFQELIENMTGTRTSQEVGNCNDDDEEISNYNYNYKDFTNNGDSDSNNRNFTPPVSDNNWKRENIDYLVNAFIQYPRYLNFYSGDAFSNSMTYGEIQEGNHSCRDTLFGGESLDCPMPNSLSQLKPISFSQNFNCDNNNNEHPNYSSDNKKHRTVTMHTPRCFNANVQESTNLNAMFSYHHRVPTTTASSAGNFSRIIKARPDRQHRHSNTTATTSTNRIPSPSFDFKRHSNSSSSALSSSSSSPSSPSSASSMSMMSSGSGYSGGSSSSLSRSRSNSASPNPSSTSTSPSYISTSTSNDDAVFSFSWEYPSTEAFNQSGKNGNGQQDGPKQDLGLFVDGSGLDSAWGKFQETKRPLSSTRPPTTSTMTSSASMTSAYFDKAEQEKFSIVLAQIRQHLLHLPCLDKKQHCKFCKNNKESFGVYSTHLLKDSDGRVICPILRNYVCPLCGATGTRAHTIKYCPLNDFDISDAMDKMLNEGC